MKHRIKIFVRTNSDGDIEQLYVPEYKYKFWPFWLTYSVGIDDCGSYGTIQFSSFNEAEKYIRERKNETYWTSNHSIEIK